MTQAIFSESDAMATMVLPAARPLAPSTDPGPDVAGALDDSLVVRSQAGHRAAFEQLIRRSTKLVFARIYLETARADRAEDLVQETYLLAWRSIGQLTDAAGWRSWLLAIAHSVVIDSARHDSRQKRGGVAGSTSTGFKQDISRELESLPTPRPGPPELAGQAETKQQVLQALRDLPEDYRLPLTLRYLHGADYETIARQLGITNGSLRGLLNRGVTLLRQELTRLGIE